LAYCHNTTRHHVPEDPDLHSSSSKEEEKDEDEDDDDDDNSHMCNKFTIASSEPY